jgi:hypothetical protein
LAGKFLNLRIDAVSKTLDYEINGGLMMDDMDDTETGARGESGKADPELLLCTSELEKTRLLLYVNSYRLLRF